MILILNNSKGSLIQYLCKFSKKLTFLTPCTCTSVYIYNIYIHTYLLTRKHFQHPLLAGKHIDFVILLTNPRPLFPFYIGGFLMFSRGYEKEHQSDIAWMYLSYYKHQNESISAVLLLQMQYFYCNFTVNEGN